nr:hypothetical protein [Tanacetum cinerariifolium]
MNEQIVRDLKIAIIHEEEELQMLIDSLDRNNETIAKYLQEYEQFAADLSIKERIELINDLVKYQENYAKVLKYQSQQRKPFSKKQQREFYMLVLKSHSGWKTKHFKGMSLEEIREKFILVWKQIEDFVPIEDLKTMMQLVPVEEVYVEALQVKHPIIDLEIHTEGQRTYWKIIRLGGNTAVYQFFVDMLKHFDREDLNQLWTLVKETLNIRQATSDKEKELWVELKRLYEPDVEDQLWTHSQALMHDLVEWRLYDTCGVHHERIVKNKMLKAFPLPVMSSHIRQFWSTARVETSDEGTKILATVDDESASPLRDDSQGEACLTISSLEAEHGRANIIKSSTLPYDSTPRFTSLAADEGSMKQKINDLTDLCTRLQRQQTEMASKITAQDLEIASLKAKIKLLEDKDRGGDEPSGEDAIIKGRSLETGEEAGVDKSIKRGSNDREELVNVLASLDAANNLTSRGVQMVSVSPAAQVSTVSVPTGSDGKRNRGTAGKKDQRMNEHISRDEKIARIHAEEQLQMLIDSLDRNNETVAKYLQEYEQFAADLSIRERIELINDLVKYQDNYAKVLNAKKVKTSEEVSEEDLKTMMQLVPVEEVYVEALQVKNLIIDWEIHTKGERTYWKIIRDPTAEEDCTADEDKGKAVIENIMYRTPCPIKRVLSAGVPSGIASVSVGYVVFPTG